MQFAPRQQRARVAAVSHLHAHVSHELSRKQQFCHHLPMPATKRHWPPAPPHLVAYRRGAQQRSVDNDCHQQCALLPRCRTGRTALLTAEQQHAIVLRARLGPAALCWLLADTRAVALVCATMCGVTCPIPPYPKPYPASAPPRVRVQAPRSWATPATLQQRAPPASTRVPHP